MKAYSLFSGSKGNCIYIKSEKTHILIDCGVCEKRTRQSIESLGDKMDDLDAIFITHEHSDHVNGLRVIEKRYSIPVHITALSAKEMVKTKEELENMYLHEVRFEVQINDLEISSFELSHDSVCAVGYVVKDLNTMETLGIATDTGTVTSDMKTSLVGCKTVILESNHDSDMLKFGSYPEDLKRRIKGKHGHLSNENAAEFACYLVENGTKRIVLFHLSDENNKPELAIETVKKAVNNDKIQIMVAEKNNIVEII